MRMGCMRAPLLLVVLLLASTSTVLGQAKAGTNSTAEYRTIYDAGMSEVWLLQQLVNGNVFPNCGYDCWAKKAALRVLLEMARQPGTKGTVFLPGTETAFQRQAEALCLTLDELLNAFAEDDGRAAMYVSALFLPNRVLYSKDFKNGMDITTRQGLNFTLHQDPNSTAWSFKEGSSLAIPGTARRLDLNITKTDIKAGQAVVHLVDLTPRIDALDGFWQQKRREALRRAGYPEDSLNCPPKLPPAGPSNIGLFVGLGVTAAALLLGLCGMLFWAHKKGHCSGLKRQLTRVTSGPKQTPALPDIDPENPSPPAPKELFDADRSHTEDQQKQQHQQQQQQKLFQAAVCPPPAGPIYVNAPASSSAASSTVLSCLYSSGPSISSGPLDLQPQGSAGYNVAAMLSGTEEKSPFAAVFAGTDGGLLGPGASRSVVLTQPPSATTSSSSRISSGSARSTRSGSNRPASWQQQQQQNRSSHGSGSCRDAEGSGGREGSDRVSPLPNVMTYALNPTPTDDEAHEAAVSYEGGLRPTESVPIGQIPHALVVPWNELKLDEMIGTGAEGKVYRGTWKHTEIAAKEYLCGTGGLDTEAAKANAQAALAKEVYCLTRLNHPNLVRFCAVCLERPLVVMEYYKKGSVFNILRKAEQQMMAGTAGATFMQPKSCADLDWDRRLMMLHDVAAGMSYLHARNHIHGDLRSPNLFVGTDGKVKIGDFGFTKRLGLNKGCLRVARITHPRWVAPELLMHSILSRSSDVYSFGIIMYELLTFKIPFEELKKEQVVVGLGNGTRPAIPAEHELPPGTTTSTCLWSYVRLMEECWQQDPKQRPSFEVIARRLKAMQRWRLVINDLQPHVQEALTRRTHSMPAMMRSRGGGFIGGRTQSGVSGSVDDEQQDRARRTVSAPPTNGQPGGVVSMAELLRADLMRPLSSRKPQPGVPSIPEAHPDQQQQQWSQQQQQQQALVGDDPTASVCVSSTVVAGVRLAIIPTSPTMEEEDALTSLVSPELIAEAKRVLLVASDLPASYEQQAWRRRCH